MARCGVTPLRHTCNILASTACEYKKFTQIRLKEARFVLTTQTVLTADKNIIRRSMPPSINLEQKGKGNH